MDERPTDDAVRRLLETLPGLLELPPPHRNLRLTANFQEGMLVAPLQAAEFRIPVRQLTIAQRPQTFTLDVLQALEEAAVVLGIDRGDSQLVAEYEPERSPAGVVAGMHLRWLDMLWPLRRAPL